MVYYHLYECGYGVVHWIGVWILKEEKKKGIVGEGEDERILLYRRKMRRRRRREEAVPLGEEREMFLLFCYYINIYFYY